jgi:hypothetical protein
MPDIEVTVALYGVPNDEEEVLSEEEAIKLFGILKAQESMPAPHYGYYLQNVQMEGDRKRGRIMATARWRASNG